jgi:hypothetical protein
MLQRRDFVGDCQFLLEDFSISGNEKGPLEDLWRLHRVESIARNSATHETLVIRAFQRVRDRFRKRRGAVLMSGGQDLLDLFRRNQRPGGIVNRDIFRGFSNAFQAGAHGVLALSAAGNNLRHLFELVSRDKLLQLCGPFRARNQNDLPHAICPLESANGVGEHRSFAEQREQFVESHSLAAARRDDDGAEHDGTLQR